MFDAQLSGRQPRQPQPQTIACSYCSPITAKWFHLRNHHNIIIQNKCKRTEWTCYTRLQTFTSQVVNVLQGFICYSLTGGQWVMVIWRSDWQLVSARSHFSPREFVPPPEAKELVKGLIFIALSVLSCHPLFFVQTYLFPATWHSNEENHKTKSATLIWVMRNFQTAAQEEKNAKCIENQNYLQDALQGGPFSNKKATKPSPSAPPSFVWIKKITIYLPLFFTVKISSIIRICKSGRCF